MDAMAAPREQSQSQDLTVLEGQCLRQLANAGFTRFDDLWDLPQDFVEPANIRRNGWSGVSTLTLSSDSGENALYFLKRQENQSRYSLRYPTGALTFRYEADALQHAVEQDWPSVEMVAFGFRTHAESGAQQGLLLTKALTLPSLASYETRVSDWTPYLPQLRRVGEQLLQMHLTRWQHGALFPAHLFVDLATGDMRLIDFERARKRFSAQWAAYADFTQFIRRSTWLPDNALHALLESHRVKMPRLLTRLARRFPDRFKK